MEYNKFPENSIEITDNYNLQREFFDYCIDVESRQPTYAKDGSLFEGLFSLKCFWICKTNGIGYGIMDDWKQQRVRFFRFGTDNEWNKFKMGMSESFRGDNS